MSTTEARTLTCPPAARAGLLLASGLLAAAALLCGSRATAAAPAPEAIPDPAPAATLHRAIEARLGIQILGLRRSAGGYMLDFRYRLLDPAKAAALLDRKIQPYLQDEATGAQLSVPVAPKVGQLRPTSRNRVIPGRSYYMLFANPGRALQAGSQVTLIVGDLRIPQLTVE